MQLITTWLMAILMLLGGVFSPFSGEAQDVSAAAQSLPSSGLSSQGTAIAALALAEEDGGHTALSYADIQYEHVDPQWFYEDVDTMTALAEAGEADRAIALYDALSAQLEYVDSMYTLAMLHYDADFNSNYWSDEYIYTDNLWMEMADALSTAAAEVLESPIRAAFAVHIGEEAAADFAGYEPMTDEEIEANDRKLELLDEYNSLYDAIGEASFEYRGETWTYDMLNGYRGDTLWRNDYDGYVTVYYGIQGALIEEFAPIFIELTELFADEAAREGYDNYADYAYEQIYGRSYTPEQAQTFCDAVKPIAREYYYDLYYSDVFDAAQNVGADMDTRALFEAIEKYLPLVDESLLEPWQYMTNGGFYDIAAYGAGRYSGSYTTSLSYYGAPVMFVSGVGGCDDLTTITHEFGHYCDFYYNPVPDALTSVADLDLDEIHSNGLQALFTSFYGDIFGSDANIAAFSNIAFLLENVVDGCMFDEFQRRVFDEPYGLTAERLNEIYLDICLEYGIYDPDDLPDYDATWVYISHLFESPMYYFSYAASAFAALQIWDIAQEDFDAAADVYMSVLNAGAYDNGYFTVLDACGLRLFDEPGAAEDVLSPVLDWLETTERAALRHGSWR